MTLHADELPIDEELVTRMLTDQLPAYRVLSVRRLAAPGSSSWCACRGSREGR